jgi:hypothetical protein
MIDEHAPREHWHTELDAHLSVGERIDREIGRYFRAHWRRRLATTAQDFPDAVARISRQMRKQGIPVKLARVMLCSPESTFKR